MTSSMQPPRDDAEVAAFVQDTSVTEYLETQNLEYMLYTISDRAIPAASDGMKPGQRRLIYSMHADKLAPGTKPRKSAKNVASATGSYHPHGGAAMYGTLVNLAVPHRRVRLVDGIGSFGQSPGDTPAADRYTESRLAPAGYELTRELADKSVPMRPTYDNMTTEPEYLPARFPALLVGGATGMAEAYATSVPAHNPREVMELAAALLDDPDLPTAEMQKIMPGPDWGTGGTIIGDLSGIADYYETGRGKVTVRGRIEQDGKTLRIRALPPGVNLPTLIASLREKVKDGSIPGVSDVANLTDLDSGMNVVVTVKRGTDPQEVVSALWRETKMETTFAASLVALDGDNTPRWWSVRELFSEFLARRDEIVRARSGHRLEQVRASLHLARALAAVALDKERASRIILDAADRDAADAALSTEFDLDDVQARHITGMALHRLTKADALAAQKRADELDKEAKSLEKLIASAARRRTVIRRELAETAALFDTDEYARRTMFDVQAQPADAAGDGNGGGAGLDRWRLDTDAGVFGEDGRSLDEDSVVWAVFASGKVKVTDGRGLPKRLSTTPLAPDVSDLLACGVLGGGETLILTARSGKVLRLDPAAINPQGIAGSGIAGMKLDDGDALIAAHAARESDALLTISAAAHKVTPVSDIPVKGRGTRGVGVHTLRGSDEGVIEAAVASGFTVNGTPADPSPRSKATVKKPVDTWESD